MKTLIIHHLEPMWDSGLQRCGTSFEELEMSLAMHLDGEDYDHVILTRFEDWDICSYLYPHLIEHVNKVYDYAYAWNIHEYYEDYDRARELFDDWLTRGRKLTMHGTEYCKGGNHSEYVEIADWMRELQGEVFICGAFDGECIEDLEIALDHVGVEYKRLREFIV